MKSPAFKVKFSPQNKPFNDVIGIEVGAGLAQGVPAVRLRKKDGKTEIAAAGFLALPDTLPTRIEDDTPPPVWSLPKSFQAQYAALAVTSDLVLFRHAAGLDDETGDNKQLAYRTVSRMIAPDLPPLTVRMPEFQAKWAAKLLPEGRAPTACSLQASASAAINTFIMSSRFESLSGTAVILFVFPKYTSLAAFHDFRLVLYREHNIGYAHIRDAISSHMRIEQSLTDSILEDAFIDPTPMIEPVLRTLYRQVEISYDYLTRRRNCQTQDFLICGLPSGLKYWTSIFNRTMNLTLSPFQPFDDIGLAPRATVITEDLSTVAPFLMTALGAALAVVEDV